MSRITNKKKDKTTSVSHGVPVGSKKDKTDWHRLNTMTEEEIERNAREDPDSLRLEDCDLTQLRVVMPKRKKEISLRIDNDVVDYFQSFGRGYQTRMNAVLRAYMEAQKMR